MKLFKHLFFILSITILITSCQNDDDFNPPAYTPTGDYIDGFFVVNEGPFGGSGSLSFINNDFSETNLNVFATENPNEDIGSFVQSVFFDEERMFIISNGSNLINVVNRYTLEFIALINTGLEVPRYGTIINDKAYVSNLASFDSTTDDYIAVIDLINYEVEASIAVNNIANQIFSYGGKLIVENASFSNGNTISLIDPLTQQIIETIEVGDGLNSLVISADALFTLSSAQLTQINLNNFSISNTLALPSEVTDAANFRMEENQAYYTRGNSVFTNTINDISFTENPIFSYTTSSLFGSFYGFQVKDQQVYIADAGDFASNGKIFVFDLSGNLLFETEVDLGPNGFYFN